MSDPYAQQAEVADLSRRVAQLEALFFGASHQIPHANHLVSLYWDACRQDTFDSEVVARHWERQLFALDARGLLVMARLVRDPTPWHPLLILLDRFIAAEFDLETCRQHILTAAQDLLKLQSFSKVQPRDIRGNPLRIKTALATISRRGSLHGTKT